MFLAPVTMQGGMMVFRISIISNDDVEGRPICSGYGRATPPMPRHCCRSLNACGRSSGCASSAWWLIGAWSARRPFRLWAGWTLRPLHRRDAHAPHQRGRRGGAQKQCALDRNHPLAQRGQGSGPLKLKEVKVQDRRYVVCLNEEERRKDARDRQAILASLAEQLRIIVCSHADGVCPRP